jgi:hypothetical protein
MVSNPILKTTTANPTTTFTKTEPSHNIPRRENPAKIANTRRIIGLRITMLKTP